MKLLVSDYDGTIYDIENLKDTKNNIDAIKKFKDNGNLFSIATARPYPSIKTQTEKFDIPYDYLICCDGACVFDNKDNLIYSNPIDKKYVSIIAKYLESLKYVKKYKLLNSYGMNTTNMDDVHQIYVEVFIKNIIDILLIKKELSALISFGILHVAYFYKKTFKSDGIKFIADLNQIRKNDIYTIGNGHNDIDMLQEYNGSRVPFSYPKLLLYKFPKNSIPKYIKKIESGKI